jgi:Fe-S-cluster-containing hydrogenase component 2
MYDIKVDDQKCVGCGEWVGICPQEAFELQDEKSVPVAAESVLDVKAVLKSVRKKPYL